MIGSATTTSGSSCALCSAQFDRYYEPEDPTSRLSWRQEIRASKFDYFSSCPGPVISYHTLEFTRDVQHNERRERIEKKKQKRA